MGNYWKCSDCRDLEGGGCTCTVRTGWQEKPTACPMDKSENCHWKLLPTKRLKK